MDFKRLSDKIEQTHQFLQNRATAAINVALTIRNWLIGYYIVEYEQNGEDRAKYGEALVDKLAVEINLTGLSARNLKLYRQFYHAYPHIGKIVPDILTDYQIVHTVSAQLTSESPNMIMQTLSAQFNSSEKYSGVDPLKLIKSLNFSHLTELLKIDNPLKRAFYEVETIRNTWSVRELRNQVSRLLFERTGLSTDKEKVIQVANKKAEKLIPDQLIRDPMVFEFLGIKPLEVLEETDLEKALLSHIEEFLVELGNGFCFEARQKKMLIDNEYHFVDLVFYHRLLHCHVLVDLKIDEFKHEYAGQLNSYVNYYKENMKAKGDKHPFGILLCTGKSQVKVKYALGGMQNRIFVNNYLLNIPSKQNLVDILEKHKREYL